MSVSFVELEQSEQLLELVAYTGGLLQKEAFVEELSKSVNAGQHVAVLEQLIKVAPVFFTGGKEAESTLNSIGLLISKLKAEETAHLAKALNQAIVSESIKGFETTRLKSLAYLFNKLPKSSNLRFDCYLTIVTFAAQHHLLDSVLPQFSEIPTWIKEWQCTKEQARILFKTLAQHLYAAGKAPLAIDFQLKLLATFDGASATEFQSAKADIVALLSSVISHPDVFEFGAFLKSAAVKQLAGEPVLEVLQLVFNGDLAAYTNWAASNGPKLQALNISEAPLLHKVRLLALASLCAKQSSIEFATIANTLQVPADETELWIIDVIRAGLVEAKIDEVNEKVIVSRSTHVEFGSAQWADLRNKLQSWSTNLSDVQQVLDGVRAQLKSRSA